MFDKFQIFTKDPVTGTSGSTICTEIDLGTIVKATEGPRDVLRQLSHDITDEKECNILHFTTSLLSPIYFILIKLPKARRRGKFLFNPNG